jgi:hypothetical protein
VPEALARLAALLADETAAEEAALEDLHRQVDTIEGASGDGPRRNPDIARAFPDPPYAAPASPLLSSDRSG